MNICISYFVYSNAHTTPVRIYGEPYANKFCAGDIFWNITRRQGISPVANFHHVPGRGFMIQRVIVIFIKYLSSNQNQQFSWKCDIYIYNLFERSALEKTYFFFTKILIYLGFIIDNCLPSTCFKYVVRHVDVLIFRTEIRQNYFAWNRDKTVQFQKQC